MANKGVTGRIVFVGPDEGPRDLKVTIRAFDIDPITEDDHLGETVRVGDGVFSINYEPGKYRAWFVDRNPDIEVRIYGPGERLLWETPQQEGVSAEILDVGTIEIHKRNFPVLASGSAAEQKNDRSWLVTHTAFDPKNGDAVRLEPGNEVEWLVDGAAMFPAITDAIEKAAKSVRLLNLFFKIDKLFSKFDFSQTGKDHKTLADGDKVKVSRLEKIMLKRANDLNIPTHVLVWNLADIFLFDDVDTADEVANFFQGSNVLTDVLTTTQLLHIKLVVVDDTKPNNPPQLTAYVIGSTMSQGYFSDQEHLIHDARHGGSLMHDASLSVKGPAVRHVDQTFSTIWNAEPTASPVDPAPQMAPISGGASVQVLRTLPGELFTSNQPGPNTENLPHGETGILEAYQRAIMKAEEYIYIEDQYFTSKEIVDAIKLRVHENTKLEVILVLNIKPDIAGYPEKQTAFLNELLQDSQIKDRIGVFTLWTSDASRTPFEINNIYVHAKLAIIDDKWATVGTANIDGASLNQRQWELIVKGIWEDLPLWKKLLIPLIPVLILLTLPAALPRLWPFIISAIRKERVRTSQHAVPHRERQPPRHPELNLVVYNDVAGQPQTGKVRELREKLWEEQLGAPPPAAKPSDGWVKFWNDAAQAHLGKIQNRGVTKTKILKWKPFTNPEKNLKALGVSADDKTKYRVGSSGQAGVVKFIPEDI